MLGKRVSSKAVIQEEGEELIFRPVHILTCHLMFHHVGLSIQSNALLFILTHNILAGC